jgi:hypothetical protein
MKIVKQLPALLLAFVFVVFGAIYFIHPFPMPKLTGNQLIYMNLFVSTGYMNVIKVFEIFFGLLLVFPKTRALGLILIAPIIVNILCFELLIAKQPGIGVILIIINIVGIYLSKDKYAGIIK